MVLRVAPAAIYSLGVTAMSAGTVENVQPANSAAGSSTVRSMLNKVPEVTVIFWIVKMMSTTVGETAADYLNLNLGFGLFNTMMAAILLFVAFLVFQMRQKEYIPAWYWGVVVLVSVVGTLITDYMVDTMGISLEATTVGFSLALAATFAGWFASEKTLSIHTIFTSRRESFYWLAILFTFALGTAAGDLIAESVGLGYAISAAVFGSIIAIIYGGYLNGLNAVFAFWAAYIITRPFGASLGDLLSQSRAAGGLDLGTTGTSMLFLAIIAGFVCWMTYSRQRP